MSDSLLKMSSLLGSQNPSKDVSNILSSIVTFSDILKKASETKILEFIKVIGKHKSSANEIKELKNGYFASYGTDNRIMIYDRKFNLKSKEDDIGDWIYHIIEITNQEKMEKDIEIIICTNECLYLYQINIENIEKNTSRLNKFEYGGVICLEIKNNNYIICGDEGAYHFSDLFNKIIQTKKNKLFDGTYRGGFVINPNLVAFTSNRVIPGGEDKLKFYNPNSKKIVQDYSNYSFIMSSNGLALFENENKNSNKIFLAACKKYYSQQKNGILLVVSSFRENELSSAIFEETGNFEVYCFCLISIIKNDNLSKKILDKEKDKAETIPTNFFFVGGFDADNRNGLIKLYKINFSEKIDDTNIEFIQDIIIEETIREFEIQEIIEENKPIKNENINKDNGDEKLSKSIEKIDDNLKQKLSQYTINVLKERNTFNRFNGPITSIIQSSSTGNILVTCNDGNVFLFTPPNLDYYLSNNIN